MSANDLLLWMSARREGSWQQFRGAIEALNLDGGDSLEADGGSESPLPIQHALQLSLERLAHAEFSRSDRRWRVVPPSLALFSETYAGVLCGARTPQTIDDLKTAKCGQVDVLQNGAAPDRVILRYESRDALITAARTAGLRVQDSASETLLAAHGSIRRHQDWTPSELPPSQGWAVHRFSNSQLRWLECPAGTTLTHGLFRFVLKHQRFYYMVKSGRCFRVQVHLGKYAVLRRKDILRYDEKHQSLSVPTICSPPLLVERALILCSGQLPAINDSGRLEYRHVPPAIARLAAEVLCQELG